MITALRSRTRPDNLVNQVRPGGQSLARRVYLGTVCAAALGLAYQLFGALVFLDAPGLVMRDTQVVATDHAGLVTAVHVVAGDEVEAGQQVAALESKDILDRIADLSGRIGQVLTRERQIAGRLSAIVDLLPLTAARNTRAQEALARTNDLATRGLTTSLRIQEALREAFEAERDLTQLVSERRTLLDEAEQLRTSRRELSALLATTRQSYDEGRVIAKVSGTVAASVVSPGTVTARGAALIEIFHGEAHVRTFVPGNRLYPLTIGMPVVVSDGSHRRTGRIERVEAVSERLPQEFQSQLRGVERHQLVRVRLDGEDSPFASPSKVRVIGRDTPAGWLALISGRIWPAEVRTPVQHVVARQVHRSDSRPLGSIRASRQDALTAEWRMLLDSADARLWRALEGPDAEAVAPLPRFTLPARHFSRELPTYGHQP